jgi:ADP-heptose:LPS heptosyltransferase
MDTLWHAGRNAKQAGRRLHVVLLPGGLGDTVAAEPVLRVLKQDGEDLFIALRPGLGAIFDNHPDIDGTICIKAYSHGLLLKALTPWLRWTNLSADRLRCSFLKVRFRNKAAHGITAFNFYDHQRTLSEAYAMLALGTRLDDRPEVFGEAGFDTIGYLRATFADASLPLLVLHSKATEDSRTWPAANVRDAVTILQHSVDVNVLECGLNPVLSPSPRVKHMADQLSLPQQISVIQKAAVFLGVDSGFSHIADAAKVPMILLLAQYMAFRNYLPLPDRPGIVVIRAGQSLAEISGEQAAHSVLALLGHDL